MTTRSKLVMLCAAAIAIVLGAAGPAMAVCDVKSYGATGDGVTDDRLAVQAAMDACFASGDKDVYFPPGTYQMSRAGTAYYCIKVPPGVRVRGASQVSTMLRQAPGIAVGVRLLYVREGADGRLSDLTLDGFKSTQSVSEQRHGLFLYETLRFTVERVTSRNFTGDGFYLFTDALQTTVRDVTSTDNDRNGITMGGRVNNLIITASRFVNNAAQQVDSESGSGQTVDDITIVGNILDGGTFSNEYALTVSGLGPTISSSSWTVSGNVIRGPIFIVWAKNVSVTGNTIFNTTTKPCVTVYRRSTDDVVSANTCEMTQNTVGSVPGIDVIGTGTGDMPERIVVSHNIVKVVHPDAFGVRAMGVISVTVDGNTLRGGGMPGLFGSGIYVRATHLTVPFRTAKLRGNTISNFGNYGIYVAGNGNPTAGYAKFNVLDISGNTFDDDSVVPTQLTGVTFAGEQEATAGALVSLSGNTNLGGVANSVVSFNSAAIVMTSGSQGAAPFYSVAGSPEGVVIAPVGSLATRRDTGVLYRKSTGKDANGWTVVTP